jgi:tetratricopeptide (TPR) repeat protein
MPAGGAIVGRIWLRALVLSVILVSFVSSPVHAETPSPWDEFYALCYQARGGWYLIWGDLDGGLADLSEAIRLDPSVPERFTGRAYILYLKKRDNLALAAIDSALKINPKDALAFYTRGLIRNRQREYEKALEAFGKVIQFWPTFSDAHYQRSSVHWGLHQNDLAMKDLDEALRLNPEHGSAYALRGTHWLERNELDKSIADSTGGPHPVVDSPCRFPTEV